jgi:hypothetical protein
MVSVKLPAAYDFGGLDHLVARAALGMKETEQLLQISQY